MTKRRRPKKKKHKSKSPEKLSNKYKQDGRPILITPIAFEVLNRLGIPLSTNCIHLYLFYLAKGIRDTTNRIWCKDTYAAKGLGWSIARVKRAKAKLVELGYIRVEQEHNEEGQFDKSYIVLKYYARKSTIDRALKLCCPQTPLTGDFYTTEMELEILHERIKKALEKGIRRQIRAKWKKGAVGTKETVSTKTTLSVKNKRGTVSTKTPLSVKRASNTYSTKEDNTYKEHNVAQNGDGVCSKLRFVLFTSFNNKSIEIKLKDRFYYKRAKQLYNALQSKDKICKKADTHKWAAQFNKLHAKDEVEKSFITEVLKWYIDHIGEKYVPWAFSAGAFRTKFDQIAAAMNRGEYISREYEEEDDEEYVVGGRI